MDPTDVSKRKPRRTQGTPSFYYRNRFACAVIVAGTAIFGAWSLTPFFGALNDKIRNEWVRPSEEELDRRVLFSFPAPRTSPAIQATLDAVEQRRTER